TSRVPRMVLVLLDRVSPGRTLTPAFGWLRRARSSDALRAALSCTSTAAFCIDMYAPVILRFLSSRARSHAGSDFMVAIMCSVMMRARMDCMGSVLTNPASLRMPHACMALLVAVARTVAAYTYPCAPSHMKPMSPALAMTLAL